MLFPKIKAFFPMSLVLAIRFTLSFSLATAGTAIFHHCHHFFSLCHLLFAHKAVFFGKLNAFFRMSWVLAICFASFPTATAWAGLIRKFSISLGFLLGHKTMLNCVCNACFLVGRVIAIRLALIITFTTAWTLKTSLLLPD